MLYHQAFNSLPKWWTRTHRILQPVEIHLEGEKPVLVELREEEQGDGSTIHIEPTILDSGADSLPAMLKNRGEKWFTNTLFIYARAEQTYGEISPYAKALKEKLPIIYLMVGKPPKTTD